jgi:hypothetical protein
VLIGLDGEHGPVGVEQDPLGAAAQQRLNGESCLSEMIQARIDTVAVWRSPWSNSAVSLP